MKYSATFSDEEKTGLKLDDDDEVPVQSIIKQTYVLDTIV